MSIKQYCTNCGAVLNPEALFCHKCGVRVLSRPDQPMVTRESMTASENYEPILEDTFAGVDTADMSLTSILNDLEMLTSADNPSLPGNKTYRDSGFSYTEPGAPMSSMIPDFPDLNDLAEEPAMPQPEPAPVRVNVPAPGYTPAPTAAPVETDDDPWPWEMPTFNEEDDNPIPPFEQPASEPENVFPEMEAPQPRIPQMPVSAPEPPAAPQPEFEEEFNPDFFDDDNDFFAQEEEEPAPAPEPVIQHTDVEDVKIPKRRSSRRRFEETDTNPYLDATGTYSQEFSGTIPPEKPSRKKQYTYDEEDEEEFEDEYAEPKRWPFVILSIILMIAIVFTALFFFKPAVLDMAIDKINTVAHTDIPYIGGGSSKPSKPVTTPTVSVVPSESAAEPSATPEIVVEPEDTFEPELISDEEYLDEVSSRFCRFYNTYLNAMNNDDLNSLDHVSDSLKADLIDRYEQFNKDYTFKNREMYLDAPSYFVYSTKNDGEYDVTFIAQAYNTTIQKSDESEVSNNPIMDVTIRYTPETGDWTVTKMEIDNSASINANDMLQIVE